MRLAKLSLLMLAGVLLGTDDCSPELPEEDEVITTDPEAVRRLREGHSAFLVMLVDYTDEKDLTFPPGSESFRQLTAISAAIPSVVRLTGAQLKPVDATNTTHCNDSEGSMTFTLDVEVKRALGRTRAERLVVGTCNRSDARNEWLVRPFYKTDTAPPFDAELLAMLLSDVYTHIMLAHRIYADDFEREQHAILGRLLGCPEGSSYNHTSSGEHWCAAWGVRHGPSIQGELSALLEGVRQVEGNYIRGARDGHWVTRDATGAMLEESWWQAGTKIDRPAD